jgi:hypothetical protein
MRVLKFVFWVNMLAVCAGVVLAVACALFNDHPTTLDAWRASLSAWQPVLWSCYGFVWFTVAFACLNSSAPSMEGADAEDVDCAPCWTHGHVSQIHPFSGNMMSCGVDCDGNMSGAHNPPTFD